MEQNVLHLDVSHGLAGDMFLGLLVDLGVPLTALQEQLQTLDVSGWTLRTTTVQRGAMAATRIEVACESPQPARHLSEILTCIEQSGLSTGAKARAQRTFTALAEAEASVHGVDIQRVHFHEVGAVDAIIDICGTCIGLEILNVDQVVSGPLPGGTGTVECAHGTLTVPVPAVVSLASAGFELQYGRGRGEMVTPTGMALLVGNGMPIPDTFTIRPSRMGFGAGQRDASVLRGTLGVVNVRVGLNTVYDWVAEDVVMLCTHVDDVTGERLTFALEALMSDGALDVTVTPCLMKKGRAGHRVEVMAALGDEQRLSLLLMKHTGTLGVRVQRTKRWCAPRSIIQVVTEYGPISVKRGPFGVKPEYEDCAAAARLHDVPLHRVVAAAEAVAHAQDSEV